jgi:hypothetical protein
MSANTPIPSTASIQDAPIDKGMTRRGLTKAALWTVPVVAVATAAPMAAASEPTPPPIVKDARIVFDTWRSNWNWKNGRPVGIRSGIQIQHVWTKPELHVDGLQVTITFPEGVLCTDDVTIEPGSRRWMFVMRSGQQYIFAYAGVLPAGKSSLELNVNFVATPKDLNMVYGGYEATATAEAVNAVRVNGPSWGNPIR